MTDTLSITLERELSHPPEKVWRALTQPHLMEEWLMKTDFQSRIGHSFSFRADWGAVDCKVLALEEARTLSYSWGDGELDTVVTWTLTPLPAGTLLRMEQTGFRKNQPRYFGGAQAGWPRFLSALEDLLSREA